MRYILRTAESGIAIDRQFSSTFSTNKKIRKDRFRLLRTITLIGLASALSGCNWTGSLGGPERISSVADEVVEIKAYANSFAPMSTGTPTDQVLARNNLIAARMYVIDMEYTQYESQLMREGRLSISVRS